MLTPPRLFVASLVVAAAVTGLAVSVPFQGTVLLATLPYLLQVCGGAAAAFTFERGDRLRWAWLSIALGGFVGGLSCLALSRPPLHTPIAEVAYSRTVMHLSLLGDLLINVFIVTGIVILAQAWRSLGPLPRWYNLAAVIALAAGLLLVGPSLYRALPLAAGGDLQAWSAVISMIGDLAVIAMVGPLAVTALSMRGGALAWPYLFLSIGAACWLFFDASGLLRGRLQLIADLFFAASGLIFTGAAGLAHRRAIPR